MATSTQTNLKQLFKELIQMPTLTAEKATCRAALDWIKYQLRDLPLYVHEFVYNGHSALVVTTQDTKRPKVMLHTHIDVSPARMDQILFTEHEGKYFGRGVFDMKFAAATFIMLLLELGDDLPSYDIGATFTTDEETGGNDGARRLAADGWGGEVMINPDAPTDWAVQRAAKGMLEYRIHSRGLPGHGSRPWMYRNAVTQLVNFLDALAARFPTEPCGDNEHSHQTLNVGLFNGGDIANQVPAKASAEVDIRMMPGTSVNQMKAMVQEVAASFEHITLEYLASDEPIEIDTAGEYVVHVQRIIQAVTGAGPSFALAHGASESGYYMAHGVTVLMFAPPGGGHHSDNEWVDARGVHDFLEITRRFVEETARTV